jgi:16S rRNA (uracil1498-N3)-methyltransferase
MRRSAQSWEERVPAGRFVVTAGTLADGAEIELDTDHAHQARDVLRLAVGDPLTLLDGLGGEWPATLSVVTRARVTARVGARRASAAEPRTRVVLYQGLLKGAKLELVLQKGTELGVAAFVPVASARAVASGDELGGAKRARWQRILVEATEQCGRARVPELRPPQTLAQALASLPADGLALMPWEEEHTLSLRAALLRGRERWQRSGAGQHDDAGAPEIALFIGPEGGFGRDEVAMARAHGVLPVTLGPRILRAETAALVAAALALEACGDLG